MNSYRAFQPERSSSESFGTLWDACRTRAFRETERVRLTMKTAKKMYRRFHSLCEVLRWTLTTSVVYDWFQAVSKLRGTGPHPCCLFLYALAMLLCRTLCNYTTVPNYDVTDPMIFKALHEWYQLVTPSKRSLSTNLHILISVCTCVHVQFICDLRWKAHVLSSASQIKTTAVWSLSW